jgi:hypothetical protein
MRSKFDLGVVLTLVGSSSSAPATSRYVNGKDMAMRLSSVCLERKSVRGKMDQLLGSDIPK